jgi:hypothetical protein
MPLPGTVFVLALHGTTPTCEAWTVSDTALSNAGIEIEYRAAGDRLDIKWVARGDWSAQCDGSIDVTDPRLFATREACTAAIAHRERLAMSWPCQMQPPPPAPVVARTQRRFDEVLTYGSIMYGGESCQRMRFEAKRPPGDSFEGELIYRIDHGLEEYGYEGQRGAPTLMLGGPVEKMDDGQTSFSFCAEEVEVEYFADHVEMMGELYFDHASCQAAHEREAYRRSWLPKDQQAARSRLPIAGGC